MNTPPNPPVTPPTVWEAPFPWEGDLLLEQLGQLSTPSDPVQIHAYVSESPEVRAALRGSVLRHFEQREQAAAVRVRSAFKTGYFWITEEVMPLWRRHHADTLTVLYPPAPGEHAGRFLQELYPLAAVLEREGLRGDFRPGTVEATYEAVLARGGRELWRGRCAVPLHRRASPDGRDVLAPTGWLTVQSGERRLHDERLPTDAERFWDWYSQTVLPHLLKLADERSGLPIFKNLSVSVQLSEPDVALGVLGGLASMTEALEEEVYFGTLDALKHRTGTPAQARTLMPGRIAPVVISTPGQAGRAWVRLTPWTDEHLPPEYTADSVRDSNMELSPTPGPLQLNRPWKPSDTWASARRLAERHGLEWQVPASSVDGRPVPAVVRREPGPASGVLVTGGQHANETTGPVAAVQLIERLAAGPLPFAVLPLENPDGAHLHWSLIQINPEHMHHAARYTSLGDDLESRLAGGLVRWENRARRWAAQEIGAGLHLNLHGYPAHEWIRPFSGYAPFGFESWALPVGFLTILWYHPGHAERAQQMAQVIASRLSQLPEVVQHAAQSCRAAAAHSASPHYELIGGLPFLLAERPGGLCPITVITEAPDETIYGPLFELFVRAHLAVCEAAIGFHLASG